MLKDKVVLITGANGALGKIVSKQALQHGADIIRVDRYAAETIAKEQWITVDLTDQEATSLNLKNINKVDVLFHIAGGFSMGSPAFSADKAEWDDMFKLNVDTFKNTINAIIPIMLKQGRGSVVSIGAAAALYGKAEMSAYCAAKRTVMSLTESLSAELKNKGINVNSVLPSIIDTPANRQAMPSANFQTWVNPYLLADTLCFLGSDMARAINGALIPVKGLLD